MPMKKRKVEKTVARGKRSSAGHPRKPVKGATRKPSAAATKV